MLAYEYTDNLYSYIDRFLDSSQKRNQAFVDSIYFTFQPTDISRAVEFWFQFQMPINLSFPLIS